MALGVNSAPSENEYQEHFLGVKAAGAWGWRPHHLHVPNVMKSGSINILKPSGPHRACFTFTFTYHSFGVTELFSEIGFLVTLLIWFKYGWGTLHTLKIVWTWTLNHNKDSKHVSPVTESLTVQTQTCTDTLRHETSSKFCLRNTALLVVCCTALWQVARAVCSFYWTFFV